VSTQLALNQTPRRTISSSLPGTEKALVKIKTINNNMGKAMEIKAQMNFSMIILIQILRIWPMLRSSMVMISTHALMSRLRIWSSTKIYSRYSIWWSITISCMSLMISSHQTLMVSSVMPRKRLRNIPAASGSKRALKLISLVHLMRFFWGSSKKLGTGSLSLSMTTLGARPLGKMEDFHLMIMLRWLSLEML